MPWHSDIDPNTFCERIIFIRSLKGMSDPYWTKIDVPYWLPQDHPYWIEMRRPKGMEMERLYLTEMDKPLWTGLMVTFKMVVETLQDFKEVLDLILDMW
jgi:hypothetical protein